eukprot:2063187-Alexandrium_andersonii.AAC.1
MQFCAALFVGPRGIVGKPRRCSVAGPRSAQEHFVATLHSCARLHHGAVVAVGPELAKADALSDTRNRRPSKLRAPATTSN